MKQTAIALVLIIGGWGALLAQGPRFEVAAIKIHQIQSADSNVPVIAGNRFARSGNLNQLMMYAFDLKTYQLSGGPNWVTHPSTDGDYFDIEAIAEGAEPLTQPRARQMLQSLLSERFQLRFHREKREMPVYALVVGKGGPKLKESAAEATPSARGAVTTTTVASTFTKSHISDLVRILSSAADRPVLDDTRLTGFYDFKLEFARDPAAAAAESNASSLFTAVQEQLGLKLEPRKESIEIFVIDGAERPSSN